jgi:mannosyltransferase OCH1-like enzyme
MTEDRTLTHGERLEQRLPKTIWVMWIQGWNAAPDVALRCLSTWKMPNPAWVVRTLSEENLGEFLDLGRTHPGIQGKALPLEAMADVVRVALLEKHGGGWVDSTAYCNRPLDDWLHDVLPPGFFAFARPGSDRMISNWFLASTPSHHITKTWNRLNA